jgi:hypothetical protein
MSKYGNCFENALRYLIDASIDTPKRDLTLVHATVVGCGGNVKGVSYSHAFLIERTPIPVVEGQFHIGDPFIEFAVDATKDINKPTIALLSMYRKIGNITNEIHYCGGEASEMMRIHDNYGPWCDSVVTNEERKIRGETLV